MLPDAPLLFFAPLPPVDAGPGADQKADRIGRAFASGKILLLMANSSLRAELVRSDEVRKGLVVFVRSQKVWSAYEKLRTEKSFGADSKSPQ